VDLAERAWAACLAEFTPKPRRWASPLDMACDLDPTVVRTPALEEINRQLVALADTAEDRLMVFMPPQEGKSTLCSKWYPLWRLTIDPDRRIAVVSYSDEMARRWGAEIKQLVEMHNGTDGSTDLGIRLREDSRAAGRWQIRGRLGGVYCVGIAGSLTGKPVDELVLDDPIKDLAAAQSEAYRKRCQDFWQGVAIPRLGPGAKCLLIQTRWHEEDMAGWLLAKDGEGDRAKGGLWHVVSIPAVADAPADPLGRPLGQPMVSARGDRDWARIRKSAGEYVWGALYQQRPSPAEGNLFKRIAWRYWREAPQAGYSSRRLDLGGRIRSLGECWRFATVDLAASTKTSADWTVIAAWAHTIDGDLVLLDRLRARIGEADHFAHVLPLVQRWQLDTVFVEKSQYGFTLVREAAQAGIPLSPVEADVDKFTRALPYSVRVGQGRVWLPAGQWWTAEWVNEHAAFPNGANDDQVDTGAYATRVAITGWHPQTQARRPAPRNEIDFMTVQL
jgi:predicted phage terminase large subunit-like protein